MNKMKSISLIKTKYNVRVNTHGTIDKKREHR